MELHHSPSCDKERASPPALLILFGQSRGHSSSPVQASPRRRTRATAERLVRSLCWRRAIVSKVVHASIHSFHRSPWGARGRATPHSPLNFLAEASPPKRSVSSIQSFHRLAWSVWSHGLSRKPLPRLLLSKVFTCNGARCCCEGWMGEFPSSTTPFLSHLPCVAYSCLSVTHHDVSCIQCVLHLFDRLNATEVRSPFCTKVITEVDNFSGAKTCSNWPFDATRTRASQRQLHCHWAARCRHTTRAIVLPVRSCKMDNRCNHSL